MRRGSSFTFSVRAAATFSADAWAAIEAHEAGANVMVVTKLRMGDANTMMAEGGIQAAGKPNVASSWGTLSPLLGPARKIWNWSSR